jgi:phage terminase large subunit-like protein
MTGLYPDWYPEDLKVESGKLLKGRIIATDYSKGVGEVIIPALQEWFDSTPGGPYVAKTLKNPMGVPTKWIFKNGNEFDILTHEQGTDQFEGWRGDIAWFDEPPPRDKYVATLRGLVDSGGSCWLTLTPLRQPWIYDDLYTADDPEIHVTTMDIQDNPTLTQAAIDEFSKRLTDEEKEARLHGKFMHLSGLVYKEFDPEIHCISIPKVQKHWTKFFAVDPHPRTPTACLWLAVDEQENLWVYDELSCENMTIAEVAGAIKAQEADLPPDIRLIDPAMDKEDELAGGFNVRKELMKFGIYCRRANNDFDLGISQVHQALRPEYSNLLQKYLPRLRISRNCRGLIYEFQHYLWDEYVMRPEDHDPKQKAKKKNDHFLDCLRYIMNAHPSFRRMETQAEEVEYAGTYTKYPTKKIVGDDGGRNSYRDMVEKRVHFGR